MANPYMRVILANTLNKQGGTMAYAGTVTSPVVTQNAGFTTLSSNTRGYGGAIGSYEDDTSIADGTDTLPTTKPNSATRFSGQGDQQFIICGYTNYVAGVAATNQQKFSAADANRRSIHGISEARTSFLSGISWTANKDGQPTYTFTVNAGNPLFGTDDNVTVSRAVPGEFVFHEGILTGPTQKDYDAITGA